MALFDQSGQHLTVDWSEAFIALPKATAVFCTHRDRYIAALEKAMASSGNTAQVERLEARLAALRAFALEIGIEEA